MKIASGLSVLDTPSLTATTFPQEYVVNIKYDGEDDWDFLKGSAIEGYLDTVLSCAYRVLSLGDVISLNHGFEKYLGPDSIVAEQ